MSNATVPKGYKQTEVGVIPEDWVVKKFVDVTKIITCGLAATPKYVDESIGKPFLSAQNVQNGKVVYDKHKYISKELFEQITKHNKPEKGDLLYTRVGAGIGEAGVIKDNFQFGIYVSLTLIKSDERQLHNYYLLHLLNSPKYKYFAKTGQFAGAGVQNLNVQIVREFLIPLPSIEEQTAIADALFDADALIESLEKLIAKKKAIKQGTMQQLLTGKKRLPGFSGEWEVKKLGEMAEIKKGQLITNNMRIDGIIPVIAGGKTPAYYHNKANCHGKTITISASGASAGYVAFHAWPIFASDCSTIVESKNYSIEFIYFLLQSLQWRIYKMQTGGAQPHIHPSDLNPIIISIPKLEEQTTIATVFSDMDVEIESLKQKRDKYAMLKQGMMQELLTGRIRLI